MSAISETTIKTRINSKTGFLSFTMAACLAAGSFTPNTAEAWSISPGAGTDCTGLLSGSWDSASNTCTVINAMASSPNNAINFGATLVVDGSLIINSGNKLSVYGGSLKISASATMQNNGIFDVTDGGTHNEVEIEGTLENNSLVDNDGDFNITGRFENKLNSTFKNTRNIKIEKDATFDNFSTVSNESESKTTAIITNAGRLSNTGTDNIVAVIKNIKGSKIINKVGATLENKMGASIINNTRALIHNYGSWTNTQLSLVKNEAGILNEIPSAEFIFDNSILDHISLVIINKGKMEFTASSTYTIHPSTKASPTVLIQFCSGNLITNAGGVVTNDGIIVNFGGSLPAGIAGSGSVVDMGMCLDGIKPEA